MPKTKDFNNNKNELLSWISTLFIFSLIVCLLYIFLWPIQIVGNSMYPELMNNDRIIISRFNITKTNLKHGDIIAVNLPETDGLSIKRIIGVPNDNIIINDGLVYINNILVDENILDISYTSGNINLILDENSYFLMGDNRDTSMDSRILGAINLSDIEGKVIIKFYPFNKIKIY